MSVTITHLTAGAINRVLRLFGAELISCDSLAYYQSIAEKATPPTGPSFAAGELPEEAIRYLRPDNPRLEELRVRYNNFQCPAINHSVWRPEHIAGVQLRYFRGDNPYVFQYQDGNTEIAHVLTAYYLMKTAPLQLFERLEEDALFGAYTFSLNGERLLSRDLLDSISEIAFLEDTLSISRRAGANVLDIGAGYGRLAHRFLTALPGLSRVFCTDAIAASTFLCEFYLRFRGVSEMGRVVPLDEIESVMERHHIDIAVNIHSFSECTLNSICWWLDLLCRYRVPYLMIVPNAAWHSGAKLLTSEIDVNKNVSYLPALQDRGYRRIVMRPKYTAASIQKYGVSPTTYHLFELDR